MGQIKGRQNSWVRVTRDGPGQAYPATTWTVVGMIHHERDDLGEYNISTNVFTPKVKGLYTFNVSQHWNMPATGVRILYGLWTAAGSELLRCNDAIMGAAGHCAPIGVGLYQLDAGVGYNIRCWISAATTTIADRPHNYINWARVN